MVSFTMRTCEYCGRESEETARHCHECGTSFFADSPSITPEPTPREPSVIVTTTVAAIKPHLPLLTRTLYFLGGLCWLLFAAFFGFFLFKYMQAGAGVQLFGFIFSTSSVVLGVVHFIGLSLAMLMSLAFAIGMCARAVTWGENTK